MINRVIIRSKVVQVAYSYFITENKSIADAENELLHSLKKGHELYFALLQLMIDLTDLQAQRLETARNKYLPTEEERNPNTRFVDNRFIKALRNNPDFVQHHNDEPFSWSISAENFLNTMLNTILASSEYQAYMSNPATTTRTTASSGALFSRISSPPPTNLPTLSRVCHSIGTKNSTSKQHLS